jgi:hypothetical protein
MQMQQSPPIPLRIDPDGFQPCTPQHRCNIQNHRSRSRRPRHPRVPKLQRSHRLSRRPRRLFSHLIPDKLEC